MIKINDIDQLCVNTIRTLVIDAVEKANSGHAGTPIGMAPVAYTLWQNVLRYDPHDPLWLNRDRFVISAGHASLLLYSLLHLAGVKRLEDGKATDHLAITLDDIKNFRQIDSVTPGHPEYGHTTGVETTTGPLGQGCGNSVGMAIASRWLGANYNKPGLTVFDFDVYVICSDGDLMEGVASEAASLAGHLGLDNLCWIYDSNAITIEGDTELAFSENVAERFQAYGWHIVHVPDANDMMRVDDALREFKDTRGRPTLIVVKSIIGYGAPDKQNTASIHSDALGEDEVRKTKRFYGWPEDSQFLVPEGVYECFANGLSNRGENLRRKWEKTFAEYRKHHPRLADEIAGGISRELPTGWDRNLPIFDTNAKGIATREASGKILNAVAEQVPWIIGGAADLAPSTKSKLLFENAGTISKSAPGGRNIHFGVREHGMGAIINGLGLCEMRSFGATFLIFSDYMRPPLRLAALMKLPIFYVFTHDSIGVAEDGPTHQPVEQLAGLRAVPGLVVLRPADANEVREAYKVILNLKDQPAAMVLSRQSLPVFDRSQYSNAEGLARGAYVLADADNTLPQVILIGTGSEVQLCVSAFKTLQSRGINARVVSMPSWDLFEKQSKAYRDSVLPPGIEARVAVEQGSVIGWDRYAGNSGEIIGMRAFGSSAPLKDLLRKFGFTADNVVAAALRQIARNNKSQPH